jgi:sporulation related protein
MSMAEKRSDYSDEAHQPKSREAGDPLAELARLIGQSDPFADIGRPGAHKPLDTVRADDRPAPEWLARPAPADEYDDPRQAPHDAQRADRYAVQADHHDPRYQEHDDRAQDHGTHERYAARDGAPADVGHGQEHQYDDRYRVAPPPAGDYDGDHYYADDGHMPPQGEESAAPSRRRGGLLTVAAVLGLAVIGTAGAFGYRAYTSSPGGSANPPVIKADTAPAKIVPPAAAPADAQGKPFQERIATTTTERIVPREEQPVSLPVPPQPRPSAPQTAFAPSAAAPLVAPPPSTPPGAFNEPKRVRTQVIRPDAASVDPIAQPPSTSAARAPAAAKQSGSAPMAIAPQSDPGPRTKVATRTPSAPAAGSYVVQVSAQKSESEAQSSYRALQQKYPAVLGGREANIRRVDLGEKGGIFYRAQVGSFATSEQATTFCNNLKDAGGQCIVQRN